MFRHGDRTPTKEELYPTAPHNPMYDQLGYGQLTEVRTCYASICYRFQCFLCGDFEVSSISQTSYQKVTSTSAVCGQILEDKSLIRDLGVLDIFKLSLTFRKQSISRRPIAM